MRMQSLPLLAGLALAGTLALAPLVRCASGAGTADPAAPASFTGARRGIPAPPPPLDAQEEESQGEAKADATPAAKARASATGALSATPPSTVLIPTRTRVAIGSDVKDLEAALEEVPGLASTLLAETPAHTTRVDEFHLMVTEVTNEQYAVFVEAMGAQPPMSWGTAAVTDAQRAFVEAEGERIREAREKGLPAPERRTFDPIDWWEMNWKEAQWSLPDRIRTAPVSRVNYADALAYAQWAGMRLMTEFEFQSAGRAEKKQLYPWGDAWKETGAAIAQGDQADPIPVGSRPDGRTPEGVYDLLGNAWEWTSSPYMPYPRYKQVKLEVGKRGERREVTGQPDWDSSKRVVVGGSVQNTAIAARLTTRRGTERAQRTNSLGLRCAATPKPGIDRAVALQLRAGLLGEGMADTTRTLALDRWRAEPGTAKVENYAVVQGYEAVLVVPPERLGFLSASELATATLTDGPQPLVVLSTTLPLSKPELPAGEYLVSFRGPGKDRSKPEEPVGEAARQTNQDGAATSPLAAMLDTGTASFIFSTLDGTPVAVLGDIEAPRYERPDKEILNGRVAVVVDEDGKRGADLLRFTLVVPGRTNATSAFVFDLQLELAPKTLAGPWRR